MQRGQSLLELVVLSGALAALLALAMLIGVVGDAALRTSAGARFAAFDCDARPGHCRDESSAVESKVRSAVFYSDRDEISPKGTPSWQTFRSLGRHESVIQKPQDLTLGIDLPRIEGADKNLLDKLFSAFRGLAIKAGPAIFGLSSPDQLTRSTVRAKLWGAQPAEIIGTAMPRLETMSRVAMISDGWAAIDRRNFGQRVREGESPLALLGFATEGLYLPGKDLLMPVFDAIGLESNTAAFREAFHNVNHDQPYGNSRVTLP
jgi:hypothetical protein